MLTKKEGLVPAGWRVMVMFRVYPGSGFHRYRTFELRLIQSGNRQCFTLGPKPHDWTVHRMIRVMFWPPAPIHPESSGGIHAGTGTGTITGNRMTPGITLPMSLPGLVLLPVIRNRVTRLDAERRRFVSRSARKLSGWYPIWDIVAVMVHRWVLNPYSLHTCRKLHGHLRILALVIP
jgi:hypothetical protein